MKWNLRSRTGGILVVCGMLAAGLFLAGYRVGKTRGHGKTGDNPDQFYLWTTNRAVQHSFTYDPHAADVWQFDSAGGTHGETNKPLLNVTNSLSPAPR